MGLRCALLLIIPLDHPKNFNLSVQSLLIMSTYNFYTHTIQYNLRCYYSNQCKCLVWWLVIWRQIKKKI